MSKGFLASETDENFASELVYAFIFVACRSTTFLKKSIATIRENASPFTGVCRKLMQYGTVFGVKTFELVDF